MRIEKYNAARLKEFMDSEQYRDMLIVPVSPHRAESWLNNPRLEPGDNIMYLGFEGEELIAYRCILPDRHGDIRFGWLSGNWVRQDMRRKGLASRLFEEAYTDWGHQLMYTNYAPESKAVYDKSGRFELYRENPGVRYYQRSTMAGLLGNRGKLYKRSRPLLSLSDRILNSIQQLRIGIQSSTPGDVDYEEKNTVDFNVIDFLEENHGTGFSLRGPEDFNWITSWPWVRPGSDKDHRYYFSSVSSRFKNICVSMKDGKGSLNGFLWIVINGEKMSLPYAVFKPEASENISKVLNHYMQSNNIAYFTCYQSSVNEIFSPGPILNSREMVQNYYVSRDLKKQLPNPDAVSFQDGDGDVVFV